MRTGHYVDPAARARYRRTHDAAVATLPPHTASDVETPYGAVRVRHCRSRRAAWPLVLLPGTGAPGAAWSVVVPGLLEQRDVLLVDALGGPGESRQEVPLRRFADQVSWFAAMLDGLGLPAFHLAGMSMGARIALGLAARGHPGLRSLTLLEPAGSFTGLAPRAFLALPGARPGASARARRRFLALLGERPADVADGPVAALTDHALSTYTIAPPFTPPASDADLAAVDVDTLVLFGGRSTLHDPGRARRRAVARLPHARVETWPDAAHSLLADDPPALVELLLDHAARAEERVGSAP